MDTAVLLRPDGARFLKARGRALGAFARMAAGIEATSPLSVRGAGWIADTLGEHADPNVAVEPRLLLGTLRRRVRAGMT